MSKDTHEMWGIRKSDQVGYRYAAPSKREAVYRAIQDDFVQTGHVVTIGLVPEQKPLTKSHEDLKTLLHEHIYEEAYNRFGRREANEIVNGIDENELKKLGESVEKQIDELLESSGLYPKDKGDDPVYYSHDPGIAYRIVSGDEPGDFDLLEV